MRALIAAALVCIATPALAADLTVYVPDDVGLPACDDPSVLADIVDRQHWTESHNWHNGVRIQEITSIRQNTAARRSFGVIASRHCRAVAYLGPRLHDELFYVISGEMGFASVGWYVDYCMPDYDYYRVYDADCRVLR